MSDTEPNPNIEYFDVFLCHNSEDKAEIRQIADELLRRSYKPWLDEREILPGQLWQATLEEQIHTIDAAAVFIGKSGISPWQHMEIRTFIDQFVKRACPVIPVILSSATETPELPIFLQNFHWVDFRKNHQDPYEQLISGIAGMKSGPEMGKASASVLLDPGQDDAEGPVHSPMANPPDQKQQEQLGILRDRVQEYWIDGVLRQSLYHEVLILLGKRTMDEVVERSPWKYDAVDLPDRFRNVLPKDYTINAVFDATGLLLILGEPGSGKTTSLLELAAVLINRTKNDPKERIPIVLNLSSWQKKQSLEEWIAAELSAKYRVPKSIARAWLTQNYLVPLLDGLDEVQPVNQPDCVMAINAFIETHNPSGLVVCSRLMEYHWLPKKLKLNGAVCIELLSPQDVNNFLAAGGAQLAGLKQAMSSDPVLQELAQTPLMLSIMSLACEGADGKVLTSHKDDSPQARREQIFQLYVERMFQRKKSITNLFSQDQAIGWLSWLARKMKEQSQSVFMLEEIQPAWLNATSQRMMYEGVLALSVGLLFSFFLSSFVSVSILYDMMLLHGVPDLLGVLLFMRITITSYFKWTVGIGVCIWGGCRWVSPVKNGVMSGLFGGLLFALETVVMGRVFAWGSGAGAWEFHIIGGVSCGIFLGLLGGAGIGLLREIHLVEIIVRQFWKKMISGWKIGLIAGASFGSLGFLFQYLAQTGENIRTGLILILVFGLGCALTFAVVFGLIGGFLGEVIDRDKVVNISPNEGIHLSLKNGLKIYGYFGGVVGVGVMIGLFLGREPLDVASWSFFGLWLSGVFGLKRGGSAVLKHYSLRLILWLTGATPSLARFIPFLDHCAKLILLKKVGGGYMFIHRSLLEYFAALPHDNTVKKVSPGSAS